MTMNKKERAEFDALKREVLIAKAMRFTEPVAADLPPPKGMGLTKGFLFNDYHGGSVSVACSSSVHHAYGRDDKTTTQNARWLYSTKERALRALRCSMERKFAGWLADIDEQIECEIAASNKERAAK